jgi:hypothetical protein
VNKVLAREIANKVRLALAQATGLGVDEMDDARNLAELDIRVDDDFIRVVDRLDRVFEFAIDFSINDGFLKVKTIGELINLVIKIFSEKNK